MGLPVRDWAIHLKRLTNMLFACQTLLRRVLQTPDVEYQQNLAGTTIAILILRGNSNRLADLLPLVPDMLKTMRLARKGEIIRISGGEPVS